MEAGYKNIEKRKEGYVPKLFKSNKWKNKKEK